MISCRLFHEVASIWLTFPGAWMGFLVFALSIGVLLRVVRKWLQNQEVSREEYLVCGICIGFFCGPMDSIFWEIPWSLNYIGHRFADWWFQIGVFPNLYFRQLGDIVSALFHLIVLVKALSARATWWIWVSVIASFVVGGLFVGFLNWVAA